MSVECLSEQKSLFFSETELASAALRPLPQHIAIIMDGNRRWAKKQMAGNEIHPFCGHWAGAGVLTDIVEAASDLGIKTLTVFAFSTENWERSTEEVEALLHIFQTYLEAKCQRMVDTGVRFHVIGDLSPFSYELKMTILKTQEATKGGESIDFVVALNYGGRDEIKRAIHKLSDELLSGRISKDQITENTIARFLDTAPFGDPDLLIRTSGERRVSNFLLWQMAYAEVYVTDVLWPEFTPRDLLAAVLDFQKRQRRIGK